MTEIKAMVARVQWSNDVLKTWEEQYKDKNNLHNSFPAHNVHSDAGEEITLTVDSKYAYIPSHEEYFIDTEIDIDNLLCSIHSVIDEGFGTIMLVDVHTYQCIHDFLHNGSCYSVYFYEDKEKFEDVVKRLIDTGHTVHEFSTKHNDGYTEYSAIVELDKKSGNQYLLSCDYKNE